MTKNIYIARQPILTVDKKIYGYELLFRSIENDGLSKAHITDGKIASTRVAVNALNHIGRHQVVGEQLAFINIDENLLLTDAILSIPKEHFILELLETIVMNDEILNRIIELKKLGYRFALDDANCNEDFLNNFKVIFSYIDILKLDVTLIDKESLKSKLAEFRTFDFALLAEKVETQEDFEYYKGIGCIYFQGYFFAKPSLIQKKVLDPIYSEIFNLIKYLDDEYSIEEISHVFEDSPDVTIQLLKFMNSGILTIRTEIRSIKHSIALLGRQPLKRWLLLIAFSKSEAAVDGLRSPILAVAQSRAKLMSQLVSLLVSSDINKDEASLVGILSLIDVITEVSMEVVLEELALTANIKETLLDGDTELALLLKLIISIETSDMDMIDKLLNDFNLSAESIREVVLSSYNI